MSNDGYVKVAIMGATGTGKSAFIRHLTNDTEIHIGHDPESETSEVQTAYYTDPKTGRPVMLIDTPGFDDSRDGVTDTDILQKITDFLQPEKGEVRKLNGIIYMHRISDPRVGGLARKNLRMFRALCGEKSLHNVRIITTYWDRVGDEGPEREERLKQDTFQSLLASGAQMVRHSNNAPSAQSIMTALIPLKPVSTQLQDDVAGGKALGETDAGRIINKDIEDLKKKHAKELADLKREMEEAARDRDEALRAELDAERRVLEERVTRAEKDQMRLRMTIETLRNEQKTTQEELMRVRAELERERQAIQEKMVRVDDDRKRLGRPLQHPRAELAPERRNMTELHEETAREAAKLQVDRDEMARTIRELRAQLDIVEKQREELEAAQRARQMAIQEVLWRPPSAHTQRRESRHSHESSHLLHGPSDQPLGQWSENKRQQLRASEADLRRRLKEACEKEYELEDRPRWAAKDEGKGRSASRGGSYLGEAKSIVRGSEKTGKKYGGTVGALIGGAVGVALTPAAFLEPNRASKESRGG